MHPPKIFSISHLTSILKRPIDFIKAKRHLDIKPTGFLVSDHSHFTSKETKQYKISILLVIDEPTDQLILTKLLDESGYSVDTANSGNDMLDRLEQHSYDIVVTNLHLQDFNGIDVIKLYRFMFPDDKKTKFIILIDEATVNTTELKNEAECNVFLTNYEGSFALFSFITKLTATVTHRSETPLNTQNKTKLQDDLVLNINTLKALEEIGWNNSVFMHNLFTNYLNESLIHIKSIENLINEKKYGDLYIECHRLKGISLSIGADLISQTSEDINKATQEELIFRGAIMITKLWSNYCRTRVYLEKYMKNFKQTI